MSLYVLNERPVAGTLRLRFLAADGREIGRGEAASSGSVVKGEIVDMESLKTGVSITDLGLNEYALALKKYMEDHPDTDILGSFVQDGDKIRHEFLDISQLERKTLFLLENVGPIHPSVMIRKSFLDSYDLEYDEKFVVAQDYDLWVRCNEFTNIRFYPEVLLIRRKHPGQIGKKRNTLQHEMAAKIKTQRLLPMLDSAYTEDKTFRILLSVTDGGATYSELCKFLRTIKRCMAEDPLYDRKAIDYIVSAYKIRYLRNNYSYIKKRIFQFGLLLSGEYIVYFRYLQNKLKIREMNE